MGRGGNEANNSLIPTMLSLQRLQETAEGPSSELRGKDREGEWKVLMLVGVSQRFLEGCQQASSVLCSALSWAQRSRRHTYQTCRLSEAQRDNEPFNSRSRI